MSDSSEHLPVHPSEQQGSKSEALLIATAVDQLLSTGGIAALTTLLEAPSEIVAIVGAKLLVDSSGSRVGTLGNPKLDDAVARFAPKFLESREEARTFQLQDLSEQLATNARVLIERIQPEPRMVICGAGHVGASLAKLANLTGYGVTLIDDRSDFLTRERFAETGIQLVVAQSWADAVRTSIGNGGGVAVAIVTRGHNEDEECLRAVMTTTPDYVGLIGSKRRTNIVLGRLRERGVDEARLRMVRAPIGLDIGAVTPEEVALAILAEIVSARRGGKGESLSSWRRAP